LLVALKLTGSTQGYHKSSWVVAITLNHMHNVQVKYRTEAIRASNNILNVCCMRQLHRTTYTMLNALKTNGELRNADSDGDAGWSSQLMEAGFFTPVGVIGFMSGNIHYGTKPDIRSMLAAELLEQAICQWMCGGALSCCRQVCTTVSNNTRCESIVRLP
jgi:hypothetical protein